MVRVLTCGSASKWRSDDRFRWPGERLRLLAGVDASEELVDVLSQLGGVLATALPRAGVVGLGSELGGVLVAPRATG